MGMDILFLEKDCQHCGVVQAALNMESVVSDEFRTLEGNEFLVMVSLSNRATQELLGSFGQAGKSTPLLVKSNGETLESPNQIITYLRNNKLSV